MCNLHLDLGDDGPSTPLHEACKFGNLEVTRQMLRQIGASGSQNLVSLRDSFGNPPLITALKSEHTDISMKRSLVEHFAGVLPESIACVNSQAESGYQIAKGLKLHSTLLQTCEMALLQDPSKLKCEPILTFQHQVTLPIGMRNST